MNRSFIISTEFAVSPETMYDAWLNSEIHSGMTGGSAQCSSLQGESFSAWDNYITGVNIELIPGKKIVQSWRTSDFPENEKDSLITITLQKKGNLCVFTLKHEEIPDGQPDYEEGWKDHYFNPMKVYFTK